MVASISSGVTGGAAAVISRAIASDMYSGNELTKFGIIDAC